MSGFQNDPFFLPQVGLVFSRSFVYRVLSDSRSRGRGAALLLCLSSDEAKSRFPPNRLGEAILTSSHNLCFGTQIRKVGIPLHSPVFSIQKWGLNGYTFPGHVLLMLAVPADFPLIDFAAVQKDPILCLTVRLCRPICSFA